MRGVADRGFDLKRERLAADYRAILPGDPHRMAIDAVLAAEEIIRAFDAASDEVAGMAHGRGR